MNRRLAPVRSQRTLLGCLGSTLVFAACAAEVEGISSGEPAPQVAASAHDSAASLAAGLGWLRRHQDPAGHWSSAGYTKQCVSERCPGEGDVQLDVGVTGLSLLAFLAAGNTTSSGADAEVVRRGIDWLVAHQDPESGLFGEANSHQGFLYDHALASLAVSEAYVLGNDPALKSPVTKAVAAIQSARNPYAGWRYALPPDGQNDMSVTGWMLMALISARDAKITIDEAALADAHRFIESLTDEASWRTGYLTRGGYSAREPGMAERWPETKTEAMTALAILCRMHLGEKADSEAVRGGAERLRKRLPVWTPDDGTVDLYYWYHGTNAMFQLGGDDWRAWSAAVCAAVIPAQRRGGELGGSWDPQYDPWGHRGGRVFSTAIMTLTVATDARAKAVAAPK